MSDWLYDLIIVVAVVILWLGLVALALRGWRRRGRAQAQAVGELPPVPADLGEPVRGPETGMYVGSTLAPSWTTRIATGDFGDRALVAYSEYPGGILLARTGASDIWIPAESITALRTENRLAGKVMSRDGLLVIRWRLASGLEVDSGIRGDDKSVYPDWTAPYREITEATFAALNAGDNETTASDTKRKKS
ncbi:MULTISPECIES: PH-like domain-containing protein [unclassified Gordonia (in: high G+C Gram-positive bacteria)]|uniref:PH-like domain-containing protein n=1 Tax=unclassified Gordonia (in: high G+C Gram-positive bacteria) TaxID=2657482 RepID=UPI001FFE6407|nr:MULTISPECIES: transporter [unclassified Gordonia (in: high G+C Gram-positive bacteria)]UQE73215.1 transporter [Gordonia sp. PP30]